MKHQLYWFNSILLVCLVSTSSVRANPTYNDQQYTPEQIEEFKRQGHNDGHRHGSAQGNQDGSMTGYNQGKQQCTRQARQQAKRNGYRNGYQQGEPRGSYQGQFDGEQNGRAEGQTNGRNDGRNRADSDAYAVAQPAGLDRGIEEANASEAADRGRRAGHVEGKQAAERDAYRTEYPKGKTDFYKARFSEPVQVSREYVAKPPLPVPNALTKDKSSREQPADQPNALTLTDETSDSVALRGGQNYWYQQAYNYAYRQAYDNAYQRVYNSAHQQGCRDGRNQDFRPDYNRAYNRGKNEGYQHAYNVAFRSAYDKEYTQHYNRASSQAYDLYYNDYYETHFETARRSSYQAQYSSLYDTAYNSARDYAYRSTYPGAASRNYELGRADEQRAFVERPLRLTGAAIIETNQNGVQEPEEELRFEISLRNFATDVISADKISLQLVSLNQNDAVIEEWVTFPESVEPLSALTVTQAFTAKVPQAMVEGRQEFSIRALFNDIVSDELTVTAEIRHLLEVKLVNSESLLEGLESQLIFSITNRGNRPFFSKNPATLSSTSSDIELPTDRLQIGELTAGEQRHIRIPAIARTAADSLSPDLLLDVTSAEGRTVGIFDRSPTFTIANTHRIVITSGLDQLGNPGIHHLEYALVNRTSPRLNRSLQVETRLTSQNDVFNIGELKTQYLKPLQPSETVNFIIPISASDSSSGGDIELRIYENGQLVVVHRDKF